MIDDRKLIMLKHYEAMSSIDEDLLLDALPPSLAEGGPAPRRGRNGRRRDPDEDSALGRFMSSPLAAAVLSVVIGIAVVIGVAALGRMEPPMSERPPAAGTEDPTPPEAADMLLPGTVPFAPESADYTIATDLLVSPDATRLDITITAREPGTDLQTVGGWRVEKLLGPAWNGVACNPEYGWEVPAEPGVVATCTHWLEITDGSFTPGLYRLHAMEHNGKEYESVAYCEFAVDDGSGYYKTWTEADFADAPYAKQSYTVSAAETVPYGTKEITLTFTGQKGTTSLCVPVACRLVKLDGTAGAGAAFAIAIEKLGFSAAAQVDIAPEAVDDFVPTLTQTYELLNPAAVTPGRYRVYNVDSEGVVCATCELEIVGEELGWPGEPATDQPYTITASLSRGQSSASLSITYRATKPGVELEPHFQFHLEKIKGEPDTDSIQWIGTAEGIIALPEDERSYATCSKSWIITNPEVMKPGVYRVYATDYDGNVIATADVDWLVDETADGVRYIYRDTARYEALCEVYDLPNYLERNESYPDMAARIGCELEPSSPVIYALPGRIFSVPFRVTPMSADYDPTDFEVTYHLSGDIYTYEPIAEVVSLHKEELLSEQDGTVVDIPVLSGDSGEYRGLAIRTITSGVASLKVTVTHRDTGAEYTFTQYIVIAGAVPTEGLVTLSNRRGYSLCPELYFEYVNQWDPGTNGNPGGMMHGDGNGLPPLGELWYELDQSPIYWDGDLTLSAPEGYTMSLYDIYDMNFRKVSRPEGTTTVSEVIAALPDGQYYVLMSVRYRGQYIEEADDYESTGYGMAFKVVRYDANVSDGAQGDEVETEVKENSGQTLPTPTVTVSSLKDYFFTDLNRDSALDNFNPALSKPGEESPLYPDSVEQEDRSDLIGRTYSIRLTPEVTDASLAPDGLGYGLGYLHYGEDTSDSSPIPQDEYLIVYLEGPGLDLVLKFKTFFGSTEAFRRAVESGDDFTAFLCDCVHVSTAFGYAPYVLSTGNTLDVPLGAPYTASYATAAGFSTPRYRADNSTELSFALLDPAADQGLTNYDAFLRHFGLWNGGR